MKRLFSAIFIAAFLLTTICMLTACGNQSAGSSSGSNFGITTEVQSAASVSSLQTEADVAVQEQTQAAADSTLAQQDAGAAAAEPASVEAEPSEESAATSDSAAPVADQTAPAAADSAPLTTEQIAEYAQLSYNDLISAMMLGVQDGWQSVTTESLGISDIFAIYPESKFGFSIQDINGDGVPELLLGETVDNDASSPIYDIFTGSDTGELIHVFTGGERNRCFLYENGTLANLASSGADDSSFIHYVLEDGLLVADDSGESGGNYVDIAFQYFSAS